MKSIQKIAISVVLAAVAAVVPAQTAAPNPSDYFSSDKLHALAAELLVKAKASPGGSASETLDTYAGHYLSLTVRVKSGGGEVHLHQNDVFVVLDGEATEMTGGLIPDIKFDAAGEGRGDKVVGGTAQRLTKGDAIHITAGTPHQTLVEPGKTFTYFVIKVHQD